MRNKPFALHCLLALLFPCCLLGADPPAGRDDRKVVSIDASWLRARGDGPYLLDEANTIYLLKTDIRTRGTAFVVGAADITLDLGGHRVTYGDSDPIAVHNGGFEAGDKRDVPGWDLSDAPAAQLADNSRYLFGKRVLRLEAFNKPQRLVSEPIKVTWAGRTHTASITPANPTTTAHILLSVVDADSGDVIVQGKRSVATRGSSAVTRFIPKRAMQVRLQIEVIPDTDKPTSLDLDEATVALEGDYGVLASRVWEGAIPGWRGLSASAQALVRRKKAARLTIRNGKLFQGKGLAHAASPLFLRNLDGITVENVETFAGGMDTEAIDATEARGSVVIRRSTFRHQIANVSSRMRNFATLKLNNIQGPITVEDNHLLDCPQIGISLASNNPRHPVRVCRNEIRQNAVATNGYGIACSGLANFEIRENTIKPHNGKGITLDSFSRPPIGPGEISGNVVEVQERPNREYPSSMEAVALRLRNTVDRKAVHKDIRIHDNKFIARCGPGLVRQAFAVRISYCNHDGGMKNANIDFRDNTIRAVALSTDRAYRAKALVLDRLDDGVDLKLHGNRLESNDIALALGESSGGVDGATVQSTVIRRLTEGAERPFVSIGAGYNTGAVRNVRLIDLRYENGAEPTIRCAGTGKKEVQLGSTLEVRVIDASDKAVSGAEVKLIDRENKVADSGVTGPDGKVTHTVITAIHRQDKPGLRGTNVDDRTPPRVVIRKGNRSASQAIDMPHNRSMTIRLRESGN